MPDATPDEQLEFLKERCADHAVCEGPGLALFTRVGGGNRGTRTARASEAEVKDTAQHIEERFLRMMLERPAEEKLRMAARMFSAAKKLARAGIQLQDRTLTSQQIKEKLLLQFYGQDFTEDELRRILDSIF